MGIYVVRFKSYILPSAHLLLGGVVAVIVW
jgi:hypothetical protein